MIDFNQSIIDNNESMIEIKQSIMSLITMNQ